MLNIDIEHKGCQVTTPDRAVIFEKVVGQATNNNTTIAVTNDNKGEG